MQRLLALHLRLWQTSHMARFGYDHEILERFPNVVGGVIHADGVTNRPAPAELTAAFGAEQASVRERIGETPLSELPTLAAWRSVFRSFGVNPTKYRSAAEALLRRLTKQGELPSINALVDLANLVSIRYALPVAVFDQREVTGGTTVRLATAASAGPISDRARPSTRSPARSSSPTTTSRSAPVAGAGASRARVPRARTRPRSW